MTDTPVPPALAVAARLATTLDALAATAAHLRIVAEGIDVDPELAALFKSVATETLGDAGAIAPEERQAIIGMTRSFLLQAIDLVADPGREPGWTDTNPDLLQSIGQVSAGIAQAIAAAGRAHEQLGGRLQRDGAVFVDVGTGTGWIAMAMARAFPSMRVVGIDIFPEALTLARANVERAGLAERVQLQQRDAVELEPASGDVVWLPAPFIPRAAFDAVLHAAVTALRPGGWILPGTFPGPGPSLPERLMTIRTIRSGGHPWEPAELCEQLSGAGLVDVGEIERTWAAPVRLYAGRRPDG